MGKNFSHLGVGISCLDEQFRYRGFEGSHYANSEVFGGVKASARDSQDAKNGPGGTGNRLFSLSDVRPALRWHTEAGVLKVDLIVRTPDSAPVGPDRAEIVQIFHRVCDHVESIPIFVGGLSGWRHWVLTLSSHVTVIQPLLEGVTAKCGCNPWLDPGQSREVYEALRKGLQLWNEL